jgi:glycosyltransferase involved in cell wall biosynthesis
MVAISEMGKQALLREGCPAQTIRLVYNGVDTEKFNPLVPRTVNRDDGDLVIAMFAQMVPHKRHDILLAALQLGRLANRSWRLWLVGDGPLRGQLMRMAEELRISEHVEFFGFKRDLDGIYAAADIVALASDREGLPVTLLEGMASGRACVASPVAGVSELFDNGSAGLVVQRNTAEEFFRAIAALDDNRFQLAEIAMRGRLRALEKFSIDAMVSGYTGIYLQDARGNSNPGIG